jgi:hypothetical protein
MTEPPHPAASRNLPSFITAPSETDVLMVVMGAVLALAVLMFGILFLRLHSLPERMAHRSQKLQLEIVAVLCLISLFTHIHIFWIAGLLLALIDLPDFGTPLSRIATSAEKIAGIDSSKDTLQEVPGTVAPTSPVEQKGEAALETNAAPGKAKARRGRRRNPSSHGHAKRGRSMLEVMLCSLLTIVPDYLYRRHVQGKRLGKEITSYSVWFELRWGITACLILAVSLITVIFYNQPSTRVVMTPRC